MRSQDGYLLSNSGDTSPTFPLVGGEYAVDAVATFGTGSITLQQLGPDGSTFVTCLAALTANGYSTGVYLPPGQFRLLFTEHTDQTAHVATAVTDAATAQTDIQAIGGVGAPALALAQALVDAVAKISTDYGLHKIATAAADVTAAQTASTAAQANGQISGDATSMTALGAVDTILGTLATQLALAPTAAYINVQRIPGD